MYILIFVLHRISDIGTGGSFIKRLSFNKIKKTLKIALAIYLTYALIFGVFIFRIHEPLVSADSDNQTIDRFLGQGISQDHVVLLEDGSLAGIARINLIEQAQETIQIAYYSIQSGVIADALFGTIIDAADRGVQVQILLDGIAHNLRGEMKHTVYAFAHHPNIELQYYEPLNLLKPWTWNNRLHDKLIIVDNEYAIIGGRNIGDKYFMHEEQEVAVKDRDVLIINSDQPYLDNSVIADMKTYFNKLWTHEFSKQSIKKLSNRQQQKGINHTEQLLENLHQLATTYPDTFNQTIHWDQISIQTNKVSFIYNPIQRLNKEPWVWSEITNMMENAEDSFTLESPYVIPTKRMLYHLDGVSIPLQNVTIMTNSIASTPNPLAFSGHMRHTEEMISNGFKLLEYKGPHSVHGKTYIFDDRISMIGSFNLDARSSFLSTESMVVIDSIEFTDHLNKQMENRFAESLATPDSDVESAPFIKKLLLKALSYITALYHHLL